MPDHSRTERLVDSVTRARLLGPEDTPRFEMLRSEHTDPDGLAREMVRRQWLTEYQAGRLLEGKVEDVVLGPYVLLELLGEGGMGRVFKARHTLMNRVVALKVIRTELLAAGEARARFLREIEATARVWHPNLVTALDAAPFGDSFLLVMEYVEGRTISKILQSDGVPPIRHACDWVRQAALGLHHAHEQGLIHRDIKPSNLLLTAKGQVVKVMDLGLARLDLLGERGADDAPLTESGVVIGTPDYMAPEQAIAPRSADARSDVYGLGCTLYHLLTGRPPYPGGSLTQKLLWHQTSEPADPSRVRPSLPAGLAQVVLRMTAKRPDQRYQTAAAAAADLEIYCSAASLRTLHVPEPPPPDSMMATTPSPRTPMVRHQPHGTATYEVADATEDVEDREPPNEAPAAPPLAHPAVADDDAWWKDEAGPKPARPVRSHDAAVHAVSGGPSRPRAESRSLTPWLAFGGLLLLIVVGVVMAVLR